jgi:Mandelate racemase / muconate lactonizing enzyme, N-terminal domain
MRALRQSEKWIPAIEGPFSHTTTSDLAHLLMGEDPFETEKLWEKMYRANIYSGRRGIAIDAMSGLDMALWDIKGKAVGMPVWKLLGGGFETRPAVMRVRYSDLLPGKLVNGPAASPIRDFQPLNSVGIRWGKTNALIGHYQRKPAKVSAMT